MSQPDSDRSLLPTPAAASCRRWPTATPPTAKPRAPSRPGATSRTRAPSWHAYQLIGDVLRSEDLAAEPAADEAFLVALRARLADEPVVLAPQPRVEEAGRRPSPSAANARRRAPAAAGKARWRWPPASWW